MSATLTPTRPSSPAPTEPVVVARSWKAPIVLSVFAVVALLVFGLFAKGGVTSTFDLSLVDDAVQITPLEVPSKTVALALGLVCIALAGLSFAYAWQRRQTPTWVAMGFGVTFVLAFLCWAVADKRMSFVGLLQGTLLLAAPLIFGAMSGVLCERSGVINIAIEGQLLAGAFLSATVASVTGNIWVGLLAAPIAGLLVSLMITLFCIRYLVDQIIVGVVINVFVLGLTGFLYDRLLQPQQDLFNSPDTFTPVKIPLLGDIPIIGPVLFDQSVIIYVMYVVVAVIHVALFRTRWGLRVRAVGEHPRAADTVGINVNRVRRVNVMLGGMVAGLGGAFFTLGSVGAFDKGMSAGKGFIALAAMIFGRWSPLGALGAALLFGFADNLQSILGIIGTPIPSEFMLMAPYLATIFAVAGLVGRVRAPAADGQPYVKA
jgi:general nucleoside transport system permease protein